MTGFAVATVNRSIMTKLVGPLEIGKLLAAIGVIQALMPFASSPIFSLLYRSTVNDFPQAFLFVVIAVFFIITILVMAIRYFENKAEKLRQSEKEDIEEKKKF